MLRPLPTPLLPSPWTRVCMCVCVCHGSSQADIPAPLHSPTGGEVTPEKPRKGKGASSGEAHPSPPLCRTHFTSPLPSRGDSARKATQQPSVPNDCVSDKGVLRLPPFRREGKKHTQAPAAVPVLGRPSFERHRDATTRTGDVCGWSTPRLLHLAIFCPPHPPLRHEGVAWRDGGAFCPAACSNVVLFLVVRPSTVLLPPRFRSLSLLHPQHTHTHTHTHTTKRSQLRFSLTFTA